MRSLPPKSLPTPEDSAAVAPSNIRVVGPGARVATPDSARKRPWHDQPRFIMARSLIIPGWGQLHNRSWLKAGLVAAAETYLGMRIIKDSRRLDDLLGQIEPLQRAYDGETDDSIKAVQGRLLNTLVNDYNGLLDQRLGRQWFLGGVLAYALVDAYVDAHFRGFDIEFQNDPALPPGSRPATPADRGTRFGLRVSLRREF